MTSYRDGSDCGKSDTRRKVSSLESSGRTIGDMLLAVNEPVRGNILAFNGPEGDCNSLAGLTALGRASGEGFCVVSEGNTDNGAFPIFCSFPPPPDDAV